MASAGDKGVMYRGVLGGKRRGRVEEVRGEWYLYSHVLTSSS